MQKFCPKCGVKLIHITRFCTSCNTLLERNDQDTQPHTPTFMSHQPIPVIKQKKKISIIMVVTSLLLILLSIQNMSLSIIGKPATAKITDARQDTRSYGSNLPEPNRYKIKYEFFIDGERYSGNTTQTFKHGIVSTQTIHVRYLPFSPGINTAASEAKITGGLIIAGLGVLLLLLGIKGRIKC